MKKIAPGDLRVGMTIISHTNGGRALRITEINEVMGIIHVSCVDSSGAEYHHQLKRRSDLRITIWEGSVVEYEAQKGFSPFMEELSEL